MPSAARPRPLPPTVLIVEDDEVVAEAVAEAIGSAGYRTTLARGAWRGLEALTRERPAMILVDLMLPGMGGSEFLGLVKTNPTWSRIPRVIMTGINDPMIGIREDAAVFYKPVDLSSLIEVVKRYCERSQPGAVSDTLN